MQTHAGPVAILFDRIGPYHRARINSAAGRFPAVVVELRPHDATYGWDAVIAPELNRVRLIPQDQRILSPSQPSLARLTKLALDRIQPVAVAINGWSEACALAALAWCSANGRRAILMSESQAIDGARRPWREALKKRIVSLFASAVVGGRSHSSYLQCMGMPEERIFTGYDVVDNEHFANGAEAARSGADRLRRTLGLPRRFFLASARFIEKKNLIRLIEAFARFRELAPGAEWKLVLLGDGPLKQKLVAEAEKHGLHNDLLLPGFKQYNELPAYYGLASAFIHVSTVEQWGLVVNEAMAAGLPVLVSDRCGCAQELVHDGFNGFVLDPFCTEAIARRMVEIASSEAVLSAMGSESRRIISGWPASRFNAALGCALECPSIRSASMVDKALLALLLRAREVQAMGQDKSVFGGNRRSPAAGLDSPGMPDGASR